MGGLPGQWSPRPVTLVEPTVVVEVAVDTAFEHGRFRHAVRWIRTREDVDRADVTIERLHSGG